MYNITLIKELRDENGELVDSDILMDKEDADAQDILQIKRKYGIDSASSSAFPSNGSESFWFYSSFSDEDRNSFERGISTFYSLFIHSIKGQSPTKDGYEAIASNLLGVRL